MFRFKTLILALILGLCSNMLHAANVILIIGDGMDDHQISIARNYLKGAQGRLLLDGLPLRAAVQILTVEDSTEHKPVYVADSANTATTLATGVVTSRGRISTAAGSDEDLPTIAELASAAGLRSGIVTSASVTDATPAAFAAHVSLRLCENPNKMLDINYRGIPLGNCKQDLKAAGGPGSIAEQLAASSLDILLGGGSKHFSPEIEGGNISVADAAQANGFTLVHNLEQLHNAPADARLLGLFAPGTLPVRLQGEGQRSAEAAKPSLLNRLHPYLGSVSYPDVMRCEANPQAEGIPTLKAMTEVALEYLSRDNPTGFFLMVESASIDKQAHERKPCGSIGEMEQLEEVLATVLAFAENQHDTLILVTADHAQAAQLVPDGSMYKDYNIPVYSPGMVARIVTPEGAIMGVNYATNNYPYEEHTGANVPLFGNSEAQAYVPAFIQQSDLFNIMRDYLGLKPEVELRD